VDFIEKILHISPDQGNGSYEVLLVALAGFLILAAVVATERRRGHNRQKRDREK
jgi:hypothetical protein